MADEQQLKAKVADEKAGGDGSKDENPILEPGLYDAEVVSIDFKSSLPWVSKNGVTTGLEIKFKLLNIGDQKYPWDTTKQTYEWDKNKEIGRKSNLYKALTAINGSELPKEIVFASFIGKKCVVDMANKVSPKNGKTYSNVKDIKKLRQTATTSTSNAPADPTVKQETPKQEPAKQENKKVEPNTSKPNTAKDDFDF
jgi:hypothetical protein